MLNLNDEQILALIFVSLMVAAFGLGVAAGYAFFKIWSARRRETLVQWYGIMEWQRDRALAIADQARNQDSQQAL